MPDSPDLPRLGASDVRAALLSRREIALIDVREEDPFAQEHPLFAVQISAGRIELDAPWRLPRRDVDIAVYDDGEGLAEPAARRLQALGYTRVHLLEGGLQGWRDAGGELFRDVNVPSKAFGELVEHERGTPSLPAEEVKALLDAGSDVVVLDARRFDEYQTMSIPGGVSVPGAELALRVRDLAPDPATRVIVNCAGRTRSLIGTQSLVNAGIPNPVAALRNGTIGWTLAGFELDHGAQRRFGPASESSRRAAQAAAQALADRAGALRLTRDSLAAWTLDRQRTVYSWDVRTPEEYAAGHLPGFGSAPGGQLVQETDVFAAVRGARIVLADGGSESDGVRAAMTAHWLAQLGWEVGWLTDVAAAQFTETGAWQPPHAPFPAVDSVTPAELADQLAQGDGTLLLNVTTSANHVKGHIPGAWWVLRAQLPQALRALPAPRRIVLTCGSSALARFAAADLARLTDVPVAVLEGGNAAWAAEGRPLESGEQRLASPRIDRYRRPYEGTDAPREAMQAYLDWEFGLVAQLGRDGTHGFKVLGGA
ncbi:rhodanese homology domain-containing protein [Azohydromonas australica]|uniref:rhodanese homology domain-containing protein n=1 Tax=Azohydromonas australica TaxID=364039 RepID=UPI000405AE28|nr:rhodanese homology domain-containing protein [Azohydromonas australica]